MENLKWIFTSLLLIALLAEGAPSTEAIFENFWNESKKNIYEFKRKKTFFSDSNYDLLKKRAKKARDVYQLSGPINDFLNSMNVSHTHFYTDHDFEFYFLRSLFVTRDISNPKVHHVGAQFKLTDSGYVIREVLKNYPAQQASLQRGDVILSCNDKPFHPVTSFADGKSSYRLKVRRRKNLLTTTVSPVHESPHQSFLNAMNTSSRTITFKKKTFGYIRLWTGTNQKILDSFTKLVKEKFLDVDGLILDLRGGFGGAWYDYLDPFFESRKDYFQWIAIDKEGQRSSGGPDQKNYNWYYKGPMVVLINEGVRSGKESLAYQFKKSKRATLIGEKTAGAFTAGLAVFTDPSLNYFLYLATGEMLLDGNRIEGVGVVPDVQVPYPLLNAPDEDPQLAKAIEVIKRKMRE